MSARQRGAALLAAMLTVTLVATFAAAALWQQWRTVEVETAERARVQSAWILTGALDWSRLILIEDGRAGGPDHLAEPWAVPLEEARLSTFLAAERNVAQVDDGASEDAFLSGRILDLQARLNVANLVQGGAVNEVAQAQFRRLFALLGLPASELDLLVQGLRQAQVGGAEAPGAPLWPQSLPQLVWLGLAPQTLALLAPHATLLPERRGVNLNTAGAEVLMAVLPGLDRAGAERLITARQAQHFRSLDDVRALLGSGVELDTGELTVASAYFEVQGRLRLGQMVVQERSVVRRQGMEATTVLRERVGAPVLP
ncbi:MAG: general secretion pathway protein GspK [Burkholderiales bacterium 68-12]|nr:type II secretion system minor pseudopilin GspK [Burkholderiales bacterium]OJX30320.1 MAG: general secretion pathway protein GspK [Burkholderiales bacterium 68-12]